jgi:hypothetical protein
LDFGWFEVGFEARNLRSYIMGEVYRERYMWGRRIWYQSENRGCFVEGETERKKISKNLNIVLKWIDEWRW